MSDTDHTSDFHCATHGWWNPARESACPTCVMHLRRELAEVKKYADGMADAQGLYTLETCIASYRKWLAGPSSFECCGAGECKTFEESCQNPANYPETTPRIAEERIVFWEKISDLEKAVENREGRLRAAQKALGALREAARAVCWLDWSNNDSDAVASIDRLRDMLIDQMSETLTKTEAPIGRGVHPIMAAALASFAPPSSAPRTDE